MQTDEFAPEYSRQERIRFLALGIGAGALLVAACKLWAFPALKVFAETAHCSTVWGFDSVAVLFYGLFVGMPLAMAVLVAGLVGTRGYKILRQGRTPPVGEKVFRPTRITRGRKATMAGVAQLLAALPFLCIALWGNNQATTLVAQTRPYAAECAAGFSR